MVTRGDMFEPNYHCCVAYFGSSAHCRQQTRANVYIPCALTRASSIPSHILAQLCDMVDSLLYLPFQNKPEGTARKCRESLIQTQTDPYIDLNLCALSGDVIRPFSAFCLIATFFVCLFWCRDKPVYPEQYDLVQVRSEWMSPQL